MTMALFSAPEPQSLRFDLPAGASRQVRLRAGAAVVCVSGRLIAIDPSYRPDLPPGARLAPSPPLNAGETYCLAEGGWLALSAVTSAQVICLDPPGMAARAVAVLARLLHLGRGNCAPARLGAMHKISK
ncbi:hypothetical protein [Achromobacter xylosoxidans]|jgi:hypothetical protein|uniref:hypothetical protein n=2 Tax=Alcaligenes xylosoxydans xylosoxydans TaxID=85698 RepID=UPI001F19E08D|nr:hypothetical protein [Achromobacter xylosoxidans]